MNNKVLISSLLLMLFQLFSAQSDGYYLTNDSDGYTNVRRQPNPIADIKTKLKSGTLIYSFGNEPEEQNPKGDWHAITYLSEFGNATDEATVYIHKSKIRKLENLPALKKKIINSNTVQLIGKNRVVTISLKKFDPNAHKILIKKTDGNFVEWERIDGKDFLGSDHTPYLEKEYAFIKVKTGNHEIALPKAAYSDLFNPDDRVEAYEDIAGKRLFIVTNNSVGAGAYEVCWEIVNGSYSKRIVIINFF